VVQCCIENIENIYIYTLIKPRDTFAKKFLRKNTILRLELQEPLNLIRLRNRV